MDQSQIILHDSPKKKTSTSLIIAIILGIIVLGLIGVIIWLSMRGSGDDSSACPPRSDCPSCPSCPPPSTCPPCESGNCISKCGVDNPIPYLDNCPAGVTPYKLSYPYYSTQASISGNNRSCYPISSETNLHYILQNNSSSELKIYYQMVYNSSDCFGSPTSANAFSGWNFKPGQTYSFTIPSNITYKITDSEANIIQNVTINGTVAPFGGTVSIPLTGNNSISKPVTVTVSDGDSSLVASVSYT